MPRDAKLVGFYVAMLGAAAATFALARHLGESLGAAGPPGLKPFGSQWLTSSAPAATAR